MSAAAAITSTLGTFAGKVSEGCFRIFADQAKNRSTFFSESIEDFLKTENMSEREFELFKTLINDNVVDMIFAAKEKLILESDLSPEAKNKELSKLLEEREKIRFHQSQQAETISNGRCTNHVVAYVLVVLGVLGFTIAARKFKIL